MSELHFKEGAPISETLRTRQLATYRGRDVMECVCAVQWREASELRWWKYQSEPFKRYYWIPQQSCACHGSGWVCATCGGAGWYLAQNEKGHTKAQPCPQCREQFDGDVRANDWALALADLRDIAEQVEMAENWSA